jgi:small subunit ribosomal protein S9
MSVALEGKYYKGLGRRKESVAQVRVFPGRGPFVVNGLPVEEFLSVAADRFHALEPLRMLEDSEVSVSVLVKGGGHRGQAGAIRLGLARALCELDPDNRAALRQGGMLTRDPRAKERKKPGLVRARKAKQFTKR